MKTIKFTILIILISTSLVQSADWPQWRGPNRDGVSGETGLLKTWPEDGPSLLLEKAGLGEAYSSVAVIDDIIYTTGKKDANEYCTALDIEGNVKWQTDYGRAWIKDAHRRARCTPTVVGDRIYLITGYGDISCLNRQDGTVIWKIDGPKLFEGKGHEIQGFAESPLVIDNKVFFTPGGPKTSVVALERSNGDTLWTSKCIGGEPSFISPICVQSNNRDIIVTCTAEKFIGVYADNGQIAWRNSDIYSTITPIYKDGCLYNGHKLLKIPANPNEVHEIWTKEIQAGMSHFVRLGNRLYGAMGESNQGTILTCLDWQTGNVLYSNENIRDASIIAADGMLYCYEQNGGRVCLIKPGPENADIAGSFRITKGSGPHYAHPAISNGRLYMRHGDYLFVYNIRDKNNDS